MDEHLDESLERIEHYLDDALSEEGRVDFEAHLAACATCRSEVERCRRLAALASAAVEPFFPPELPSRIRGRVAAVRGRRRGRILRPVFWIAPAAAAAAVLLFVLLPAGPTGGGLTDPDRHKVVAEYEHAETVVEALRPVAVAPSVDRALEDWLAQAANAGSEDIPLLVREARELGLLAVARARRAGALGGERQRLRAVEDLLIQLENDAAAPALPAEAALVAGGW